MAQSCLALAKTLAEKRGIAWEMELTQAEKLLLARRVLKQHQELQVLAAKLQEARDSAAATRETLERRIEFLTAQVRALKGEPAGG